MNATQTKNRKPVLRVVNKLATQQRLKKVARRHCCCRCCRCW